MSQWKVLPRYRRGDGRRMVERPFVVVAIIFLGVLTRGRSTEAARLSPVTRDLLCCGALRSLGPTLSGAPLKVVAELLLFNKHAPPLVMQAHRGGARRVCISSRGVALHCAQG